jgi:hypothetical protein
VDFKASHGDQYRILISLHKKNDEKAFKLKRSLDKYRGKNGLEYTLDIEQEALLYREASENGQLRIIIKKMPHFAGPKLKYTSYAASSHLRIGGTHRRKLEKPDIGTDHT